MFLAPALMLLPMALRRNTRPTLNLLGKMGKFRREVVEYINRLSQNSNSSLTGLSVRKSGFL